MAPFVGPPRNSVMTRFAVAIAGLSLLLVAGCLESSAEKKPEKTGIFGKTTQEVGEHDPNAANQVISDKKIRAKDPITGPLAAYSPMMERVADIGVTQAIALFYATEGRYPKDHAEFMERIIKEQNIRLPVLPYGGEYVYDVENHQLMVKRSIENNEKAQQ